MMKRVLQSVILVLVVLGLFAVAQPSPSLAGGEERVMVEFAPGRSAAVRVALQRVGGNIHHQLDNLNVFAVTLPSAAIEGLWRNPNVVAIEEDVLRYPMAETIPWGVDAVQAPEVWSTGATGSGITVCIIDSGYYTDHEDLRSSPDVVTGEGDWSTDLCGHGTHVAGTIAAVRDNNLGVVGVSPDVSLFIVKVFGGADCGWAYSSDLIAASQVCADNGADIISMSLGGSRQNPRERRQFDALYSRGILSIAAAGNDGNTAYSYPASYSSVVSVAAVDVENAIADFSQQNDQVELAAPGVGVLSTVPWDATTNTLTVDSVEYDVAHIDYAAYGTASGDLADGGLCLSTGDWEGKIVLCQRGDISFYDKVMNVQSSGGAAAVIYNDEPGNFLGTLGDGASSTIVALSISQEDGEFLVDKKVGQNAVIVSTAPVPGSSYEAWDGTSMATPHVSAVAALLWGASPNSTNADIRDAMAQTALDLGTTGRDNAYGYGLVQADAAYTFLGGGSVDRPPTVFLTAPADGATVADAVIVSADAVDDVAVTQVTFFVDGAIINVDADGDDGWAVSWDTATLADGSAVVSVAATDTVGQTATDSIEVTVDNFVDPPPAGLKIYVLDFTLSGKAAGPNKSATAVVTIGDSNGNVVSDATVTGTWSGDYDAPVSGLTAADGTVVFQTPKVRIAGATFTFTVDNVTKDGAGYDPTLSEVPFTLSVTP
jgi:serine protease